MTRSLKHHSVHGAVTPDDESAPPAEGANLMPKKGEALINPATISIGPGRCCVPSALKRLESGKLDTA